MNGDSGDEGNDELTCVRSDESDKYLCFFLFILFYSYFFLGRLLVLYFSLVAPAICYLFFLHVVLYVFLANK